MKNKKEIKETIEDRLDLIDYILENNLEDKEATNEYLSLKVSAILKNQEIMLKTLLYLVNEDKKEEEKWNLTKAN